MQNYLNSVVCDVRAEAAGSCVRYGRYDGAKWGIARVLLRISGYFSSTRHSV